MLQNVLGKISINEYLAIFAHYALLILFISFVSLVLTFFIKKIYSNLEYSYFEKIVYLFIAPGIIIHEFAHLIIGLIAGMKPKKFQFFETEFGTGYVEFTDSPHKNSLLYLNMIFAPFIFGIFLANVLFFEIMNENIDLGIKILMIWLMLSIISAILPSGQDLHLAIALIRKNKTNIFGVILVVILSFVLSVLIIGIEIGFFSEIPVAFLLCILLIQVIMLRIVNPIFNLLSKSSEKLTKKKMKNKSVLKTETDDTNTAKKIAKITVKKEISGESETQSITDADNRSDSDLVDEILKKRYNPSILQEIEAFQNDYASELNLNPQFIDFLNYPIKPGKNKEEQR